MVQGRRERAEFRRNKNPVAYVCLYALCHYRATSATEAWVHTWVRHGQSPGLPVPTLRSVSSRGST